MSRLLKLVASVVLVAGAAVALAAGSAPARTRSQMIICPAARSDTSTLPCCGPPIAVAGTPQPICCGTLQTVCCGTPQPVNCPVPLAASSSLDPSIAGQKVTISGRWSGSTPGQTVELWQRLPGAKAFTNVAHTTTGSLGSFQFVRTGVETNRKWYVAVGSEHSVTMQQSVLARVTLEPGGGSNAYHGRVTPNHAGERVWVERRSAGKWVVIARPRLTSQSTYTFTGNLCNATARVVFPGDRRNVLSPSDTMKSSCGSFSGAT